MKKLSGVARLGAAVLAAVAALLLINVLCLAYFNRPSHAASASGATDYTWEPHSAYFDMTEGFAFNRTNNEGYFDLYDYEDGMDIDVLILGASQMQSSSVQLKDSAPVLLGEMLSGKRVYNLGMAGHLFETLASNLDAALDKYRPADYVVIEMETVIFNDATLESILDGTVPEMESYTGGIFNMLQRVDVLRLMYSQMTSYMETHPTETASAQEPEMSETLPLSDAADEQAKNEALLREVLARLADSAREHGVQLIILFDPKCFFDEGMGYLWFGMDKEALRFDELCAEQGIEFLNMCPRFMEEYDASRTLPYGFPNTSPGEGHLNKYGHAMIAEELYKLMAG